VIKDHPVHFGVSILHRPVPRSISQDFGMRRLMSPSYEDALFKIDQIQDADKIIGIQDVSKEKLQPNLQEIYVI